MDNPSNWQSVRSLKDYLESQGRVGIEGIDTRALTIHIRNNGAQRLLITSDVSSKKRDICFRRSMQLIR